jgi:hypothetical protein
MSVISTVFGGVRLSDDDAKKFKAQITYGRPKPAAVAALNRGQRLANQYVKKGYVIIKRRP